MQRTKAPSRKPPWSKEHPGSPSGELRTSGLHASDQPVSAKPLSSTSQSMGAVSRLVVYSKRSALQGAKGTEFAGKAATLLLQVRLETSPQILPQIGEFTTAYTRFRFHPRTAEKLALASYELIENAISYGSISGDVVYSLLEADRYIEVCVANDASPGRLTNLRTRIDRIRVDPEQAFQEEMSRSVSGAGARAALGLARICHEAQMDLELELDGNRVTIRARCPK